MKSYKEKIDRYLGDRSFRNSLTFGCFLFLVSLIINYGAGIYATERASNYVNDIVLSNLPVYNVDGIFVYGPFVFWIFIAYLAAIEPRRIPFILKSVALFVIIRSFFVILTHLGPFPIQTEMDAGPNLLKMFTTGNDLFFSGHTGLPFLMALLFWQYRKLAIFFVAVAIFF